MSTAAGEPAIDPLPISAVDGSILNQLRARLSGIPRFCGLAAFGTPPVLWFRLGSHKDGASLREAVAQGSAVVLPWGWDFVFGPMLTITVVTPGIAGPPPSVCVAADEPAFASLEDGRFVAVFAVAQEVVACFRMDLGSMSFRTWASFVSSATCSTMTPTCCSSSSPSRAASLPCFYNPLLKAPNIDGTTGGGLKSRMVDYLLFSQNFLTGGAFRYVDGSIRTSTYDLLASDHLALGAMFEIP